MLGTLVGGSLGALGGVVFSGIQRHRAIERLRKALDEAKEVTPIYREPVLGGLFGAPHARGRANAFKVLALQEGRRSMSTPTVVGAAGNYLAPSLALAGPVGSALGAAVGVGTLGANMLGQHDTVQEVVDRDRA
jgi:hypothetical protein